MTGGGEGGRGGTQHALHLWSYSHTIRFTWPITSSTYRKTRVVSTHLNTITLHDLPLAHKARSYISCMRKGDFKGPSTKSPPPSHPNHMSKTTWNKSKTVLPNLEIFVKCVPCYSAFFNGLDVDNKDTDWPRSSVSWGFVRMTYIDGLD